MLVDSGSSISFVSSAFYQQHKHIKLNKISTSVRSVDGSGVTVEGAVDVQLEFGSLQLQHTMVVANIEPDVLLGIDFLRRHGCIMDLGQGCLRLSNQTLPLTQGVGPKHLSCQRVERDPIPVQLAESVVLQGYSQLITQGRLRDTEFMSPSCGMVEPTESFVDKFCVSAARVVTTVSENSTVPVRLQNLLPRPVTINRGTVVGMFESCFVEKAAEAADEPDCTAESCNAADMCSDPVELFDLSHLDTEEAAAVRSLLSEFSDIISTGAMDLGSTGVAKHDIETTSSQPIRQAPRRLPLHHANEVREHVEQLLAEGLVDPSNSPWAAPIVVVRKPDGAIRLCVDYRKLNAVTVRDAFPIPRIDDAIDNMGDAQYFTTLDLASGYWQVELTNAARAKSAFVTPFGLFEWKVMPFGLCNAPATFQRLMTMVLGDLVPSVCSAYIDDTITFSKTFQEHLVRLRLVFEKFRAAGLKVKPRKCQILSKSVTYLGHVFKGGGVSPDPKNCSSVTSLKPLSSATEVRRFVGFASYYRRFIKDFATIAAPLHKLMQKQASFSWTDECQQAFDILKQKLTSSPVLTYPDPSRKFILDTDASDTGIGATLSQVDDQGREQVIAYASSSLSKSQRRYGTTRREMYAVVFFVQYFKHYLLGANFTLRTDHKALLWLKSFKDSEGILARWLEKLEAFDFTTVHRRGTQHANADALSRFHSQPADNSEHPASATAEPSVMDPNITVVCPSQSSIPVPTAVPSVSPDTAAGDALTQDSGHQAYVGNVDSESQPAEHANDDSNLLGSNWADFFSAEDIRRAQAEDSDIDCMIGWQQALLDRPKRSDSAMKGASLTLIRLWSQWKRLVLQDGLLYRTYTSVDGSNSFLQLVVPVSLRQRIMTGMHNECSGGHLATERTLEKVKARFYWPFMSSDIELHCKACALCSARRTPAPTARAPMKVDQPSFPLQRVAMDIMGPLPRTNRGNLYIVVITDYFTKWVEAFAIPDMTARTIASALIDGFICRYGVPLSIHTDQGAQFESNLFKSICELLDMKKTRTTPYHPSSDGLVERMNRTLENMLSARVNANHNDWDLHIQRCLLAYRSSVHSSTKETPARLMFGRELKLPVDIMFNDSREHVKSVPDYMIDLEISLQQAFSHARSAGAKAQKRQKDYYDVKTTKPRFAINDKVRLHNPAVKAGNTKKFLKPWTGPYRVVEVIDDVVYRIEHCDTGKLQVVHINRLKSTIQVPEEQHAPVPAHLPQPALIDYVQDAVPAVPVPAVPVIPVPAVPAVPVPAVPVPAVPAAPVVPAVPIMPQAGGYNLRNRANLQRPVRYRQ